MSYNAVAVYDLEGTFIGYAIKGSHSDKLQSTNLWGEADMAGLNENLHRLNEDADLRQFWPNPKDPEVLQIVNDRNFMPIPYKWTEGVDEEKSTYVWEQVQLVDEDFGRPVFDERGYPVMVDGENLDRERSHIVMTMKEVPVNPSDAMLRIKAASEVVAKRRAGL